MKLSYYPGCSLEGSSREYDRSIREVAGALGLELEEIRDWSCCGASSGHMTDHRLSILLSARNLTLAAEAGHDLLVPCAACFGRLRMADQALRKDSGTWGLDTWAPSFQVLHISELFSRPPLVERLAKAVTLPLKGLKLACYYGCLSTRPPKVTGAIRHEVPRGLDVIAETLGATPVSWSHQTECCGGSLSMTEPAITRQLVCDIVAAAVRGGGEALVTDCPMCQANLEARQRRGREKKQRLPVFFVTELMALSISGVSRRRRWRKHLVNPRRLLESRVLQ